MSIRSFEVQVQDDHLQRISQVRKPILAIAELIWNSLDADADSVNVNLHIDKFGGLRAIEVVDDGHGMPYSEAERLFSRLGGSWKRSSRYSRAKRRILHGKEGRGRFRAFALGRVVDWHVRYAVNNGLRAYDITIIKDHLRRVEVADEVPAAPGQKAGVTVIVTEPDREFRSLRSSSASDELAQIFALYLKQYPGIKIYLDHMIIDPSSVEDFSQKYDLPLLFLMKVNLFLFR